MVDKVVASVVVSSDNSERPSSKSQSVHLIYTIGNRHDSKKNSIRINKIEETFSKKSVVKLLRNS